MTIKVDEITAALRNLQMANADLLTAQEALSTAMNVERAHREQVNALQSEIAVLMFVARRDAPPSTLWAQGKAQ